MKIFMLWVYFTKNVKKNLKTVVKVEENNL